MLTVDIISPGATLEQIETVRVLMREYAALPHVLGRWTTIAEDLAALPHPFVPPVGTLLVGYFDGQPVGCAAFGDLGDGIGEVKRMYVRSEARGQGMGSVLLQAILDHARQAGCSRVRLDTAPELHAAIAMYERFGFVPIPPYRASQCMAALYFERTV